MKRGTFKNKPWGVSSKVLARRNGIGRRTPIKKRKKGLVAHPSPSDMLFSDFIIARDKRCLKCGSRSQLTCSHYFRRGHSAARFDPRNCICLCLFCHSEWEHEKDGAYLEFMLRWLGEAEFADLKARAKTTMNRGVAIAQALAWLPVVPEEVIKY